MISHNKYLFCNDLPTKPLPKTGKILVTGASGYIGGRLVPELLARGYKVRAMVRAYSPAYEDRWPGAEIVVADALNFKQLYEALNDIDTAYYLIHSLYLGPKEFEAADIHASLNFRTAAYKNHLKRIIYLGGLSDARNPLSTHLRSRLEVSEELDKGDVPVTMLRAAIIIGSGSASYEIIKHLARKLPVFLMPYWAKNRCQPISVRDVIKYLVGVLEVPETTGGKFDIGGSDILTYENMIKTALILYKRKAVFVPFFISNIRLFAYVTSLITPVPNSITHCLMEGLNNEVFCRDDTIKKLVPIKPISFKEAVVRAMSREEQDMVYTSWTDSYPPAHEFALKLHELEHEPAFKKRFAIKSKKQSLPLFNSVCRIGGKHGWFHNNWMWRLRGMLDSILLGVGSMRKRKSYTRLKINDVIGFWRVEDISPNSRLLLRAEMKIPGKAWLEFRIDTKKHHDKRTISICTYYDTQTLAGKLYWYVFLPFHNLIFIRLLEDIEKRS